MALLIFFVPIKIPQKSIHKSKTNETQSDSFTSRSDSLRKTSHLNNSWTWFNVLLGLARLTGRLLASLEFHGLGFYFCLALCWVSRTTSTSSLDHETVSQFWVRLLQRVSFLITERRKEEEGGGVGWLVGWLVRSVGWVRDSIPHHKRDDNSKTSAGKHVVDGANSRKQKMNEKWKSLGAEKTRRALPYGRSSTMMTMSIMMMMMMVVVMVMIMMTTKDDVVSIFCSLCLSLVLGCRLLTVAGSFPFQGRPQKTVRLTFFPIFFYSFSVFFSPAQAPLNSRSSCKTFPPPKKKQMVWV